MKFLLSILSCYSWTRQSDPTRVVAHLQKCNLVLIRGWLLETNISTFLVQGCHRPPEKHYFTKLWNIQDACPSPHIPKKLRVVCHHRHSSKYAESLQRTNSKSRFFFLSLSDRFTHSLDPEIACSWASEPVSEGHDFCFWGRLCYNC